MNNLEFTGIDYSVELDEIGFYPQASQIVEDRYDRFSLYSPWLVKREELSKIDPVLNLILNKRAILTDILSTNVCEFGFIVSRKLMDILLEFNLPTHKFYPCSVFLNGTKYEYYWLHFISNEFISWVDKEESSLKIRPLNIEFRDQVKSQVNLKLPMDKLLNQLREIRLGDGVFWESLKFNKTFPKLDLLYTNEFGNITLISKNLLDILIENNVSGYRTRSFKHLSV